MSHHSDEPVTVLETGDQAVLAVAKSLLDAAGIAYFASGEDPVELQVGVDDAREARATLLDLIGGEDS